MEASINLRMRGQGSGPGFQSHLAKLQGMHGQREVSSVKITVIDDHVDLHTDCVNMDIAVPLLDSLDQVVQLNVHNWHTQTIHELGSRFETCRLIRILHYAADSLDISRNSVGQIVHVVNAPVLRSIQLSRHTTELHIKRAAKLKYANTPVGTLLQVLLLSRCPSLVLNMKNFSRVKELTLTHCGFVGMDPINALRDSLCNLVFQNNTCATLLNFQHFKVLETLSVSECDAMSSMCILECPTLASLEICRCTYLRSLRCGCGPLSEPFIGLSIVRGMRRVKKLSVNDCPSMSCLIVEDMPMLRDVTMCGCRARNLMIDGNTCPALTVANFASKVKHLHNSYHFKGVFPSLTHLQARGRFKKLPVGWRMPALNCVILTKTCFRDPLDLSMFPALTSIDIDKNRGPALDRGGQAFCLRVIVALGTQPVLLGENVMMCVGEAIPADRLASQNTSDSSSGGS